ncbi:MAG: hypothetical protein JRC59_06590, partial [Deltaproteobacteria bacterium]|nr:hypothetical protein [Deltaproteobacteria bacterium]
TIGGLSIAGRFIMGFSSDRIGNKWALAICYGFLCVSLGLAATLMLRSPARR